jgi:hypothetical protein
MFMLCSDPSSTFISLNNRLKLIYRYQVAAERGISPETFTDRLIGVLLKEIQGI